jgi:hypothetical protein
MRTKTVCAVATQLSPTNKRTSLRRQSPLFRIVKKGVAPRFKKRDEDGVIDVSLAVRVVIAN